MGRRNVTRRVIDKVYVCDFETRAGRNALKERKTWVWAWAATSIFDFEKVEIGTSISWWFEWLKSIGNAVVYFHNLKFDGFFILYFLMRNGYEFTNNQKAVREGKRQLFTFMVSEQRTFYTITISTGRNTYAEIRDSLKKLPFAVERIGKAFNTKYQKLTLDYVLDRPEDHILTPEEQEYLKNDVRVVAEALLQQYEQGMLKMTIGSDCLAKYKEMMGGERKFREVFPLLDEEVDAFCRKAYRGGWCYVNPRYQGYTLKCPNGRTFDVNSLYPSMLHSNKYKLADGTEHVNLYPYGDPVYYKGTPRKTKQYPLYIIRFSASFRLKPNHVPTVQLKGSRFKDNVYISDSEGVVDNIYMTNVDYELFKKHYEIDYLVEHDGYKFRGKAGFFDEYVNHFMEIKVKATGAVRELAKLFLNNLYGKFAQRINGADMEPYIDDKGILRLRVSEETERKPVYVPVGAFNTAYARRFTITAAQVNYDIFAYADTDSNHYVDDTAVGIVEHETALSCWKRESEWTQARFIRQKTYCELINGEWDIKCAGMNKETKKQFLRYIDRGFMTIEHFDVGLCIKRKKLRPKVVDGGIVFENGPFQIRAA